MTQLASTLEKPQRLSSRAHRVQKLYVGHLCKISQNLKYVCNKRSKRPSMRDYSRNERGSLIFHYYQTEHKPKAHNLCEKFQSKSVNRLETKY